MHQGKTISDVIEDLLITVQSIIAGSAYIVANTVNSNLEWKIKTPFTELSLMLWYEVNINSNSKEVTSEFRETNQTNKGKDYWNSVMKDPFYSNLSRSEKRSKLLIHNRSNTNSEIEIKYAKKCKFISSDISKTSLLTEQKIFKRHQAMKGVIIKKEPEYLENLLVGATDDTSKILLKTNEAKKSHALKLEETQKDYAIGSDQSKLTQISAKTMIGCSQNIENHRKQDLCENSQKQNDHEKKLNQILENNINNGGNVIPIICYSIENYDESSRKISLQENHQKINVLPRREIQKRDLCENLKCITEKEKYININININNNNNNNNVHSANKEKNNCLSSFNLRETEKSVLNENPEIETKKIQCEENQVKPVKKLYPCKYCNKSFPFINLKMEHQMTHANEKPYACMYCNKVFSRRSLKTLHERIHTGEKPYSCSYCEKSFTSLPQKTRHERTHTYEKPYSCDFCNKSFATLSQKVIHERGHTGEKPYSCSYCDKCFTTANKMKMHERAHFGERPHSCTYCGKTFLRNYQRLEHEKIHMNVKPHKCSFCEKSFPSSYKKSRHERTHTKEKPYSCSFCNKSFSTRCRKNEHERDHTGETPYSCRYCDKCFSTSTKKRLHEKGHSAEKPFKCTYCEKTFLQNCHKLQHEMIHTNKRPHPCSFCDKTFNSLSKKIRHENTHSNDKNQVLINDIVDNQE